MSYVERLVVNDTSKSTILYDEHIVRYQFIAPFVSDKTVLDIASGSGYGVAMLAAAGAKHVIGIDVDERAVNEAHTSFATPTVEFRVGDATKLELANESAEIITSFETIEHLSDVEAYLAELKRVVSADGLVFISTPNRKVSEEKNPFHVKEYSREEFENVLRKYFQVVRIFEQKNSFSSVITTGAADSQATVFINDNDSEPLYFFAVCAQRDISEHFINTGSMNVRALKRWEQNPGWKLVNSVYRLLQKIKIV